MSSLFTGIFTALWLGILTSISPCPLATNIAAMSYMTRSVANSRMVLLSCALYSLGRMLTYALIAALIVKGLLSIPGASHFLQKYMNRILGPLLVLAGMFLLELITVSLPGPAWGVRLRQRIGIRGLWGAGVLGVMFALSFCPVSAALFFGSLVPLSLQHQSVFVMPVVYGFGTGLPVVVFAVLIALGTRRIAVFFGRLALLERWLRRLTGLVFIGVGVYLTLVHVFQVGR